MRSPAYFVDTTGQATLGVGLCGRCSAKLPLGELHSDPNSPGLMVCIDDLDVLDPWRLPARETEDITLPFVRPDVSIHDGAPYGSVPGVNDVPLPVFDVLARRLVDAQNNAILTESGQYIDIDILPGPLDLP